MTFKSGTVDFYMEFIDVISKTKESLSLTTISLQNFIMTIYLFKSDKNFNQ